MTAHAPVGLRPHSRVVGVITSCADLECAIRIRRPPDLFELRLDQLALNIDELEKKISRLRSPLIITARHPQEGGANKLSLRQRRNLLTRFLPHADYIDIELRSASGLCSLLTLAKKKKVRCVISFHDFKSTPPPRILAAKAGAAESHGASIFKVATRTDTPIQLSHLLDLIMNKDVYVPVSAMGIGKLGAISRVLLARAGSALTYASLDEASDIEGQLSVKRFRALGIAPRRRQSGHPERSAAKSKDPMA
jgi:3-dehydroquinate dehydratase-1